MSGKQFTLEFKETSPIDSPKDKVDLTVVFKKDVIVTTCFYNKMGKCRFQSNMPEGLICPCNLFISYNKDARERFENSLKVYHCKGKIEMHTKDKITYYDLWQLAKFRREQT